MLCHELNYFEKYNLEVQIMMNDNRKNYLNNKPYFREGLPAQKPHAGCWENTSKACKSRAVRRVIYNLFECSPNIRSGPIVPVTPLKIWIIAFMH